jgi:betaine reductase
MTGLFDGVSILLEAAGKADITKPAGTMIRTSAAVAAAADAAIADAAIADAGLRATEKLRIGLTIPGSESGAQELYRGAAEAEAVLPGLEVVTFGEPDSDPDEAHRQMEAALASGDVASAVTFHYNFPVGTATIGLTRAPGTGRDLFIAATTGISDTDRVTALVKNALAGVAAAKAWGIARPEIGILNLDGARAALQTLKALKKGGYDISLAGSVRGEELLRGNDILGGAADVIVCDTLSGNTFIKLLAGFSSGGRIEVSGSGYGPGIGGSLPLVNIISRASSAAVVSASLLYSARMAASGLNKIYSAVSLTERASGAVRAAG